MMATRFDVEEIIHSNSDWNKLNRDLLDKGLVDTLFSDRKHFVKLVKTMWANVNKFSEKQGITSLPGRLVLLDGTNYIIHGLIHDSPLFSLPLEFKEEISERLAGYQVICEDGFKPWFENATSFNEANNLFSEQVQLKKIIKVGLNLIYNRLLTKSKKNNDFQVCGLTSVDDLLDTRRNLFVSYLPEPLGMNAHFFIEDSGSIDNPKGVIPTIIRRYTYEALKSIEHAEKNDLSELHIVVGCAHELPLEYLLINQHILQKYK